VQVLEETPSTAEQDWRQGNFELVDDTHVQVLLDHIRAACDTNIATARRLAGLREGRTVDAPEGRYLASARS
jgi:hypothetical protein